MTPASILYKSIAGRYRPVRVADGPITVCYRFIKNAYWDERKQNHCSVIYFVLHVNYNQKINGACKRQNK